MLKRKPNCECSICGKKIYRRPIQIATGGVYCSMKCCGVSQRVPKECPICSKEYLGQKRTCSRACANIAREGISYTGENKNNNALQGTKLKEKIATERGGACEKCGYENYSILQIHHLVRKAKGGSDELENLQLLCPNCHMQQHLGFSLFKKKKSGTVHRRN